MSHGHQHHTHRHGQKEEAHFLGVAFWLTGALMVAEFVGGYFAHSLALMADAGHMLMDAIALGIAWLTATAKVRVPHRFPAGTAALEAFAAWLNALLLVGLCLAIGHEALGRFREPAPIQLNLLLIVATIGLAINCLNLWLLGHFRHGSMNVRAAWLHVAGDLGSSVAVILGSLIMAVSGWWLVDPILTLGILLLIGWQTIRLFWDSSTFLVRLAPPGLRDRVEAMLRQDPCITEVQPDRLTILLLSPSVVMVAAHLRVRTMEQLEQSQLINLIKGHLREHLAKVGLELARESTLQIEPPGGVGQHGLHEHNHDPPT